jgi:hypothetical protein
MTVSRQQITQIIDTLRMSDRDLGRVLSSPGEPATLANASVSRTREPQASAAALPRMPVRLRRHESGPWIVYLVRPRHVNRHAITFLHGGFVHRGVQCDLLLRDRSGKAVQLLAAIASCRHVHGRVHEVTAMFAFPIDVDQFQFPDGSSITSVRQKLSAVTDDSTQSD